MNVESNGLSNKFPNEITDFNLKYLSLSTYLHVQIIIKHEVCPGSHALRGVCVRQAGTWDLLLEYCNACPLSKELSLLE